MLKTIVAVERDGIDIRTLSLLFDVPSKDFDLVTAVKKAVTDYCKTKEGREIYRYNCSYFNWADFEMYVPNEFCKRYGFEKVDSMCCDEEVDWDEQLVNDTEIADDDKEEE